MSDQTAVINVIGELRFDAPIPVKELAQLHWSYAWCFASCRIRLVRLLLSRNRRRALLLFEAPDAEAVRLAFRQTQTHFDDIWSCSEVDSPAAGSDVCE